MLSGKKEAFIKAVKPVASESRIGIVYDEKMTQHEDPIDSSHPEQPARVSAIFAQLERDGLLDASKALRVAAPSVGEADLLTVHTKDWLSTCHDCDKETLPELIFTSRRFDSVFMNEASLECAKLSAGGTVELTKRVLRGDCRHGAAIVRPPGHHAEAHCAKGFCFFNNVAVAAAVARREGCPRVLIVDW
jgi:histone deacetylase 6